MRERNATVARTANGALRAVNAVAADDASSVEPFDDVNETSSPDHANHAHGLNGVSGMNGMSGARASADADEAHEPLSPDDPLAPLPFNPYKGNRGLTRAWHAMKNSLAGFRVAIREESAFRQELTLAAILIPCGVLVPVDPVSRVLLLGSVLLVLIVELLNSSVEAAIDRISLERHELSRRAKDLGSAAVMVALGMCLMTWGLIVGPLVVRWVKAWL
ncbi:diacylglycerol kinase [Paraburkholderia sp. RP-4-7]|uniref:Diacylglycerol kinase n=1 Tax=Paraburkholderia polaris TaxID=2728848 RepID=A0A848IJE2_9BURK|nr:diacylglycerol kinase [Paraburkholderia polaris]NMM02458.1 diacylglycerol kinase [Paraburkholderia polaris]